MEPQHLPKDSPDAHRAPKVSGAPGIAIQLEHIHDTDISGFNSPLCFCFRKTDKGKWHVTNKADIQLQKDSKSILRFAQEQD